MEEDFKPKKRQMPRQIPDDYALGYNCNMSSDDEDYATIPEIFY